ncbi:heterokaryon incompatibility protein-domain-containing protein, partial [Usnea florida]
MKRAYEPLNPEIREIRLLSILPSKDKNERIHGFLTHHDLDVGVVYSNGEAMSFLTLSYVWGNVEPMGKVYITDQEIHVRPNLFAALKHMRRSDQLLELWVDALCIDQGNTEERNHQVSLMDAIYSKSRGVLSWLGEQSETSHLAMTHL